MAKVFKKGLPPKLKEEIKKSLHFLAETDINLKGKVTSGTKEAFKVQKVKFPKELENIKDLKEYFLGKDPRKHKDFKIN